MKISKLSKTIAIIICLAILGTTIANASGNVVELSQEKISSRNISPESFSVQAKFVGKKYDIGFLLAAVRSKPSPFSSIIDILFMKDKVTVLSNSEFYSYVKTENGTKGYVFSGLLTSGSGGFQISEYLNIYKGKSKKISVEGISDTTSLSWSIGDNSIISFNVETREVIGLKPGTTTITARDGLFKASTCTVTIINKWQETESATANKQVTIKKAPGNTYRNIITVPKGTVMVARGDMADGSGWIYISTKDESYWGFIKLSDFPGIDYLMTEYHYYDIGFDKRFGSASTKIYDYASVLNGVMMDLFNLKVCPYVEAYTSAADTCKILSSGSVKSNNLAKACPGTEGHGVGNEKLCVTTISLRNQLINDKLIGTNVATKAVWTGHIMNGNKSSNSEPVSHTLVFATANTVKYDSKTGTYSNRSADKIRYYSLYEITHETGHQLGLVDGYCYRDNSQGHCSNTNCFSCNGQDIPNCIMSKIKNPESDSKIFCENCKNTIKNHLKDHH